MSYLLRVALPDRPGGLGALAVALGSVSADISSLDVVERLSGRAVDDIVVDVPSGTLPDTLITAAEQVQGVSVLSLRPFAGLLDAHRELELIDHVAAAGTRALDVLAEEVAAVLRVSWALVVGTDTTGATVLARGSTAPGADEPVSGVVARGPAARELTDAEVPASWTVLDTVVASAPLDPGRALVVGRAGGPGFRRSEIARLGYIAGIVGSLQAG